MLFGINISDTKKPIVNSVFVYPISEDSQINKSQNLVKLRLILQKNGSYKTENIFAYGKIGFGVSTDDQQNGASNKNGVYNIKTIYNGEEKFNVLFEKFSFAETRYLNRYIDYKYFKTNRIRVQKLFRQNNNPLSIINGNSSDGYITIEEGFTSVFTIEITDYKKNKTLISIPIKGKKQDIINPFVDKKNGDYIYADQATSITKGKFSVYIPANSLYENTYLNIEVKGDTLKVHEDIIPVHKNITITVDVSNYNESDLDKLYLGRINYKGEPYYNTTYRKGTKLSTKTRTLGSYVLVIDTTAPTIKPVNFSYK